MRASGGGARSPFWRQLLADILNKKVVTLETQEGSAYGAALLALAGTGEYRQRTGGVQRGDPGDGFRVTGWRCGVLCEGASHLR